MEKNDQRYSKISSERLISGPGLSLIFKALCMLKDYKSNLSSEEIVLNAVKNKKGFEYDACKILFELLGKFSASIALVYGAEINYKSNLQIRLGRNNNGFLSTGIGLVWTNFSIDYAYRPSPSYTGFGSSQLISFRIDPVWFKTKIVSFL